LARPQDQQIHGCSFQLIIDIDFDSKYGHVVTPLLLRMIPDNISDLDAHVGDASLFHSMWACVHTYYWP